MAEKIRVMGAGSLKIGAEGSIKQFAADATNVVLEPKSDVDDAETYLDGHSEAGAFSVTWTLKGSIKEDYSADGLQAWCFDNAGKTMPFEFVPNNEAAFGFKGNVMIVPVAVGGDVKKKNNQDFEFTATDVTRTNGASE